MKTGVESQIHISWHIAWFCGAFVTGIALAAVWQPGHSAMAGGLLTAGALAVLACLRRSRAALCFAICAGLIFGLCRGSVERTALRQYAPYYGRTVRLTGKVLEDAAYGGQGDIRLHLGNVSIDGKELPGQVWASSPGKHDIQRSDIVTVSGKVGEGFGNMAASMSRSSVVNIRRPKPGDVALHFRDWFAAGIHRAIPDPQASLGSGFLTGQHSTLPADLNGQLKVAGLTHIVVASGSNLTILVGFARRSLLKTSKYLATMAGVLMVAGFVLVTGFSPSMTRAGLVSLLSLAAWYYGRRVHPLVLLPFAAAITTAINPFYVWGDLGWYLSFGSFAGVLLLAPLIHQYFWGDGEEPGVLRGILVETSSAQLATMPVILFSFGQYSAYALLANMIVLPLIPFTMVLTFVAGIAGVAVPSLAPWAGLPASSILHYMIRAVQWIAGLPGAQGEIAFNAAALIVSYAAIIIAIFIMQHRTGYQFGSNSMIGERA